VIRNGPMTSDTHRQDEGRSSRSRSGRPGSWSRWLLSWGLVALTCLALPLTTSAAPTISLPLPDKHLLLRYTGRSVKNHTTGPGVEAMKGTLARLVPLTGRVLMGQIFFLAGINKLTYPAQTMHS
jgi:hypothetical protein